MSAKAARLVTLAIKDKKGSQRDLELRQLTREMHENPAFRDEVDSVAEGMGVRLLAADMGEQMIVVPEDIDSPFAPSFSEIKPVKGKDSRAEFMIITLGIVASYFPSSDLLYDSSRAGMEGRRMEHLIRDIKEFCARIKEENPDLTGQLDRMVDLILATPDFDPARGAERGRQSSNYMIGMISAVLNYYIDIGFLRRYEDGQGEHYMLQARFEQHLRYFGLLRLDEIIRAVKSGDAEGPDETDTKNKEMKHV